MINHKELPWILAGHVYANQSPEQQIWWQDLPVEAAVPVDPEEATLPPEEQQNNNITQHAIALLTNLIMAWMIPSAGI
jgi:hypothetical protein